MEEVLRSKFEYDIMYLATMEATQWVMSRVTEMTSKRVGMDESS